MTTYTADDFKNARFATRSNPDGDGSWVAMRSETYSEPWETPHDSFHDFEMACDGWVPVQESPCPLTADDITDEMVDAAVAGREERGWHTSASAEENGAEMRAIITDALAALTEPPSRPEGAEAVRVVLDTLRADDGEWMTYASDKDLDGLADALAELGVRVATEEGP